MARSLAVSSQGLQYFSARLRMLEKRQQQIRELRAKHERLRRELEDAKTRLMLDPDKWTGECECLSFSRFIKKKNGAKIYTPLHYCFTVFSVVSIVSSHITC